MSWELKEYYTIVCVSHPDLLDINDYDNDFFHPYEAFKFIDENIKPAIVKASENDQVPVSDVRFEIKKQYKLIWD